MYGIGIFEILLIFLVLLLFFRPAEIYSLFRRMGGMVPENQKRGGRSEKRSGWHD